MPEISLTKGYIALVDENDYLDIALFKWFADVHRRTGQVYAARSLNYTTPDGVRKCRKVKMHNQIMGEKAGVKVDHVSRDSLDNRRVNLRWATHAQNMMNRKFKKSKSGFRGVYSTYATCPKPWMAQIEAEGKRKHLGTFHDAALAARAYDDAARQLHGVFAVFNFPNSAANN